MAPNKRKRQVVVKAELKAKAHERVAEVFDKLLFEEPELVNVIKPLAESYGVDLEETEEQVQEPADPCELFAKPTVARAFQFHQKAKPKVPVPLLHDSFGRFLIGLAKDSLVTEEDVVFAAVLKSLFTEGFVNENTVMTRRLNLEFEKYLQMTVHTMWHDGTGSIETDGFIVHGALRAKVVFEDKLAGDALFQSLHYVLRLFLETEEFDSKLSHCMVILRQLPCLQFVAVTMDWTSRRLLAEPLTDMLCLWGTESRGKRLVELARPLRAFKRFCEEYQPCQFIDCSKPWTVSSWSDVTPLDANSLVHRGVNEDGQAVIAKVTCGYGLQAHNAWESAGLAPKVLSSEDMGVDWLCVIMEYLDPQDGWERLDRFVKSQKQDVKVVETSLTAALAKAHETGFVHGDLRLPNIFVRELEDALQFRAVDFDWAGREGEACYPVSPNREIPRHPGVKLHAPLSKEHDLWFVSRLSDSFCCKNE